MEPYFIYPCAQQVKEKFRNEKMSGKFGSAGRRRVTLYPRTCDIHCGNFAIRVSLSTTDAALTDEDIDEFMTNYKADCISPLLNALGNPLGHKHLPPVLLYASGADPFRDGGGDV